MSQQQGRQASPQTGPQAIAEGEMAQPLRKRPTQFPLKSGYLHLQGSYENPPGPATGTTIWGGEEDPAPQRHRRLAPHSVMGLSSISWAGLGQPPPSDST